MPFDRLIRAVDEWARISGRGDVFAQIGDGKYWPSWFQAVPFLTPRQFQERIESASGVIGHAGTGTIIAALRLRKPLLVLPRLAARGETRNDHQVATARYFAGRGYLLAAYCEEQLRSRIDKLEQFRPSASLGEVGSPQLIQRIRSFAFGDADKAA
ncbi:MAG: hypothetical protein JSV91_15255 [Phycisphaerales bacterium]|nr:MAG: hypothetical protein JSV91_15255 [Phycisphaerales bacterium]